MLNITEWLSQDVIPEKKDESWPKITVVTPSYNCGKYIEQTIRSIILQKYPNLEYIVVDAMSTDSTKDVLSRYKDFIDVLIEEKDRGQSDAINKGFRRAKGTWICWLNADDLFFPGALHEIAKSIRSFPEAPIITGASGKLDETSNLYKIVPGNIFNQMKLKNRLCGFQPSMIFNAKKVRETGGVDDGLHYLMDWDLALKLCKNGKAVVLDAPIGMLRHHSSSKTANGGWPRLREIGFVARRHQGILNRNYLLYLMHSILRKIQAETKLRYIYSLRKYIEKLSDKIYGMHGHMIQVEDE